MHLFGSSIFFWPASNAAMVLCSLNAVFLPRNRVNFNGLNRTDPPSFLFTWVVREFQLRITWLTQVASHIRIHSSGFKESDMNLGINPAVTAHLATDLLCGQMIYNMWCMWVPCQIKAPALPSGPRVRLHHFGLTLKPGARSKSWPSQSAKSVSIKRSRPGKKEAPKNVSDNILLLCMCIYIYYNYIYTHIMFNTCFVSIRFHPKAPPPEL